MTIDTLGYVKRLEGAGLDRRMAEAHAEAMRDDVVPQLATKADLDRLEQKLGDRIETALWKHSVGVLLGVLAVGGFLIRFLR